MRRNDREVTDKKEILKIISDCQICRIAMTEDKAPYIVPRNFGYTMEEDGQLTLFFHGAKEGKTVSLLEKNPDVGFEMDGTNKLIIPDDPKNACAYSVEFFSLMGKGTAFFLSDRQEKKEALNHIMFQATKKEDFLFPDAAVDGTCVFKIIASAYSAKKR